jgi:hypothetical protein
MKRKEILEGWTDHGDYVRPKRRSVDPDAWKYDRERKDDLPPMKRYEPSDAERAAQKEYEREKAEKLAAVMAMQDRMYSKIYGKKKGVDENVPPTTGTPTPAKVQKINPDGTAEIVDNKGTVTKVNQKDITPDANDPNKLNVNTQKPQVKPGTNVNMTMEDLLDIKKLAGL